MIERRARLPQTKQNKTEPITRIVEFLPGRYRFREHFFGNGELALLHCELRAAEERIRIIRFYTEDFGVNIERFLLRSQHPLDIGFSHPCEEHLGCELLHFTELPKRPMMQTDLQIDFAHLHRHVGFFELLFSCFQTDAKLPFLVADADVMIEEVVESFESFGVELDDAVQLGRVFVRHP